MTAALCSSVHADPIRIATYNTGLTRDGPGLLLRDILRGTDAQIAAVRTVISEIQPDILLLQSIDYDLDLRALKAFNATLAKTGLQYPYIFAALPNTGMDTGLDMNFDGRFSSAKDAQSYGDFSGKKGMAILSRYPIQLAKVQDFSSLLWKDIPGTLQPETGKTQGHSSKALDIQRLSYVAHWVVPIKVQSKTLTLLAFHASPPVFDGPEDRNGRRNHDELRFWQLYMGGHFGTPPDKNFIVTGDANLDPVDSEGRKLAIQSLLRDDRLQDPAPKRSAPVFAKAGQRGDPMLDTVNWPDLDTMRVDYILPSSDLRIIASGVYWPDEATPQGQLAATASRHRLVWVDITLD